MILNIEDVEQIPLGRAQDLTLLNFTHFKPLYRIKSKSTKTYWLCQCECGNYFSADACFIKNGRTISCGCIKTEAQIQAWEKLHLQLEGKKFERLKVLRKCEDRANNGKVMWECQCDCGNIVYVNGTSLKNGNTKSCGCLAKELTRIRDLERVEDLVGQQFGEVKVIERMNKSDLKNGTIWKCQCSCGNICYKPTSYLKRSKVCSCGCISQSKGTLNIEKILNENNIQYIKEYKFEDCKNINPLPFDYFLPKYNILIEFDGQQHFKQKPHFSDILYIHSNDMIKNEYCFNNGIYLIRIPYCYENLELRDLLYNSKYTLTRNNIKNYYKELESHGIKL